MIEKRFVVRFKGNLEHLEGWAQFGLTLNQAVEICRTAKSVAILYNFDPLSEGPPWTIGPGNKMQNENDTTIVSIINEFGQVEYFNENEI